MTMRLLIYITLMMLTGTTLTASGTLNSDILALHNVHVLTMEDEEIRHHYTVIVRDGIIDRMGPADEIDIPEGAQTITGELYLMPGLAEMHSHIPWSGSTIESRGDPPHVSGAGHHHRARHVGPAFAP